MDVTLVAGPRAGRREWVGLAALALPTLLVSIDVFVMLLALPHIGEALHASSTEQLWIMDSYGFLLSGFMITMGTLGDRIGRRRLLLIGAVGFGLASALGAYATTPLMLIGARALLGIAGATLAPSALALITTMFRDPKQRGVAIAVWLVCFMGGAAIGPIVGGLLLANFWWGSVFLIGVPAMAVLLLIGPHVLPEYRNPHAGRIDLVSVAMSLGAILPIVYGLKEFARDGMRAVPLAAVVFGALVGVAFVRRQLRVPEPLLDVRLFRHRAFSTALGALLMGTLLTGALMLFFTQYLQLVAGLDPLRAGVWMLLPVGVSLVSLVLAPLLARRIRPAYLIGGGLGLSVLGLLSITQVGADSGPGPLAIGWAVINLGAGPMVTLGTDIVVGSVPPEKAGSAAAINQTSGEFGFAVGIAALGSVGTAVYRGVVADTLPSELPDGAATRAGDTLAGATSAAAGLPEHVASTVLESARGAFVAGLHVASVISAVLLGVVAVLVVAALRRPGVDQQ